MKSIANLSLIAALLCFAGFFGNVALGAARQPVVLGDIAEMLLLLLSVIFFVAGTLAKESLSQSTLDELR